MARIGHHDLGDLWVPQATFTAASVKTDPTTLTVKQQSPDGTETVLANAVSPGSLTAASSPVAKPETGVFKLNPGISLDTAGYWYVKFQGTGAAAATVNHEAIADPDPFTSESGLSTRALVGLGETKDWLQQQNITLAGDLDLVRVINDISLRAHNEADREFKVNGTNPLTRTFPVSVLARRQGIVHVGDLASAPTTVQVLDTDWATVLETVDAADMTFHPIVRQTWEPIRRIELHSDVTTLTAGMRVSVTGNYGFPSVPGDVRQAVLDEVAAVIDRDVEHYRQDLSPVSSAGEATNVIVMSQRPQFLSMNPRTLAVLWSYRDLQVA